MKKGIFLAPAAALFHHGVTYAVPVNPLSGHQVEGHHAAPSHALQQPNILEHMTKPHQNIFVTENLHSQKGAIAALAKNSEAKQTHVLFTGGKLQREAMNDLHDYMKKSGVDTSRLTYSALEPHRDNTLSNEKNFIGKPDPNLALHNWQTDGHNLVNDKLPANVHVAAHVPTGTVKHIIGVAAEKGGLNHLHHHDSGAGFKNNAEQELKDKLAVGQAVHDAKGTLIWSHRERSWDATKGNPMTQPSSKLKEFNPHDHVKSAEDSSTFPHNKALAVDKIGEAMHGDGHVRAVREGKLTGNDKADYKNVFDNIRKSETKDGEAGKDLNHIKHNWVEPSKKMLREAHAKAMNDEHFAKTVATPEMIAKHLNHISNDKEYIGALEKPGMQLEYLDAHNQGALAEAALNKHGKAEKGAHFEPVEHHITEDRRVVTRPIDKIDSSKPVHWQLVNGDVGTAFHNVKQMHQGKHEEVYQK